MPDNFDSGIVYLCRLTNVAQPGLKPVEVLTRIDRAWYSERTVSFRRQYAAKGVNEQIDLLVRIHYNPKARIGMYAVLGNGDQFRIDNVSNGFDDPSMLRYTELTLSRLEDFYDLSDE